MTQLFRDQLKDAVARRKLLPFWKRTIVDFFERLRIICSIVAQAFRDHLFHVVDIWFDAKQFKPDLVERYASSSWLASFANEIAHFTVLNALCSAILHFLL